MAVFIIVMGVVSSKSDKISCCEDSEDLPHVTPDIYDNKPLIFWLNNPNLVGVTKIIYIFSASSSESYSPRKIFNSCSGKIFWPAVLQFVDPAASVLILQQGSHYNCCSQLLCQLCIFNFHWTKFFTKHKDSWFGPKLWCLIYYDDAC